MIGFVEWRDNDLDIPMGDFHRFRATTTCEMDRIVQLRWNAQPEFEEFDTSWKDLVPQLQELIEEVPTIIRAR